MNVISYRDTFIVMDKREMGYKYIGVTKKTVKIIVAKMADPLKKAVNLSL
jgi:hypothetical protein